MKSVTEFKQLIENRKYPRFDNVKFEKFKPMLGSYQNKNSISEKSLRDLFEVLNSTTVYTLNFKNTKKKLIFIGALHVRKQPNSKWFLDILDEIVLTNNSQSMLIESSSDRKEFIALHPESVESDRAILLSEKLKIPIKGMDAKNEDMFKVFVDYNVIPAGIFIWLNNFYTYNIIKYSKEEALKRSVDILYEDLTEGIFSKYLKDVKKLMQSNENLKQAILRLAQEAVEKYIGSKLDLISALEDNDVYPPFPYTDKYFINIIHALLSEQRDQAMMFNCINELSNNDNIIAMAGMGHIQVIREELYRRLQNNFSNFKIEYKRYIDIISLNI